MPTVTDNGSVVGALVSDFENMEPDERNRTWNMLRMRLASMLDEEATTGAKATTGPLEVLSLAEAAADTEPPPLLVPDVVPEGQVPWLAGHPGHGKTTVAMHAALTATRQGRPVLWLDWEGGKRPTSRRLTAMGATADDFTRLHYSPFPRLTADRDGLGAIMGALEELLGRS